MILCTRAILSAYIVYLNFDALHNLEFISSLEYNCYLSYLTPNLTKYVCIVPYDGNALLGHHLAACAILPKWQY